MTYTCTRSGCVETKTEAIAATNHAHAYAGGAVSATCTAVGYTAGQYCPDCDTWLSGHETLAKTEHFDTDGDGKCDLCNTELRTHNDCSCICHSTGFI